MREIRTSRKERSFEKLRLMRVRTEIDLKESVGWIKLARGMD
jgi:hypothetical protein